MPFPSMKTFLLLTPLLSGGALLAACGGPPQEDSPPRVAQEPSGSVLPGEQPLTTPTWWRPRPGTSWQIQLSGRLDTRIVADVYDVDLFDTPATTIAALHAKGRKVICYFSAGSFEDWRPDAARFPRAVLGNALDGWPGERWLDIRATAVRDIMRARIDLAVQKGCDGVDPDNVDGYTNSTGFRLTATDQLAFNRFLATTAHARNLAVGLKNDVDQVAQLVGDFDWQLNEECFKYNECETLLPFIRAGKPVLGIEYGGATLAQRVCPRANSLGFDTLVKNLELGAARIACRISTGTSSPLQR